MPRLPMLERHQVAETDQDIFGDGLYLHRLTLHSPTLARLSRRIGLYFRNESALDPRLRELAILQVAHSSRSSYEYSHHLKIATACGVSADDIAAISAGKPGATSGSDELTSQTLKAARELSAGERISDETFASLRRLPDKELIDLLFLISFYCGFVRFTGALNLEPEPEFQDILRAHPLEPGE